MNKKQYTALLALVLVTASIFAQDAGIKYISPNSDGIQDGLVFPLSITDKRYITEWTFVVTDEAGTIVRTIGNKEKRPEKLTFSGFWQQLFKPKQGVEVPSEIIWNGTLDSGEIAPDGIYRYYVTATDDNGNTSKSPLYTVVVDSTHPELVVQPKTGDSLVFSPDGDGNKDTFSVRQSGSVEDLWTGRFTDSAGNTVRTFTWPNSAPPDFEWDGKTDAGAVAPDGVYGYVVSATDRAGNSVSGRINNIIIDTVRPSINITIDTNYFSPNGDGTKDVVRLTPSLPVTAGLVNWQINVLNSAKTVVRSYGGTDKPGALTFDGRDESGRLLPEGDYQAEFKVWYVNGHQPRSLSPVFTLDVTPPSVQLRLSSTIFSPDGDGQLDTITIYQTASAEQVWTGRILNSEGKAVKTWIFANQPPASLVWDGLTDSGTLAPDGMYTYNLSATDRAGNTGTAETPIFELNTGTTELILTASKTAFSPVVAGQNTITFTPVVKTTSRVTEYVFTITAADGKTVKTLRGTTLPRTFDWNGLDNDNARVSDGTYTAKLETVSQNGSRSSASSNSFIVDSVAPTAEVSLPYTVFSPNADGSKDTLPITIKTSREDLWTAQILDSAQKPVRSYSWNGEASPITWNGTDEAGNPVPDGVYSFVIQSKDAAGNSALTRVTGITVDSRVPKAYITASESAFSPNGDGVKDTQKISLITSIPDGITSWSVTVKLVGSDAVVRRWDQKDNSSVPAVINWDGKNTSGNVVEGTMYATFDIEYLKGDKVSVSTPAFISSVTPPALTVKTAPQYFSPDNDGVDDDLFISLSASSAVPFTGWSFEINDPQNGSSFWKTGGTSTITERIIWDGRSNKGELVQSATDYPYTFTVTDSLGMSSTVKGLIAIDVLVIKVGDVLKIQVPSIIFRENAADFNTLAPEVVEKNNFVLKRIAGILNKFKDYKVTIEGHANNISGTEREELEELIPLSQQRADAIKSMLVKLGVDGNRLTTVGVGGRQPVAARSDRTNWWKNRRVEFILNK